MRHLVPVVCTSKLFDYLANKKFNVLDFEMSQELEVQRSYLEFMQFLYKGAYVTTDMTVDEVAQNRFALYLHKQSRLKISVQESARCNPFAVYFLDDEKEVCERREKSSGHYCMRFDDDEGASRLFQFQTESFNRYQTKSWSFVSNYCEPLHSLIICDPYLLTKMVDGSDRNDNLYSLLEELLAGCEHESPCITLLTTCIGFRENEDPKDDLQPARLRLIECWEAVKQKISNRIGDNLKLSLLLYSGNELHDRFIITNNLMIYSGYSFGSLINTIRQKPRKQTSWVAVRHAKMQNSRIAGKEKAHFATVQVFLQDIRTWMKMGSIEVFCEHDHVNRLFDEL